MGFPKDDVKTSVEHKVYLGGSPREYQRRWEVRKKRKKPRKGPWWRIVTTDAELNL